MTWEPDHKTYIEDGLIREAKQECKSCEVVKKYGGPKHEPSKRCHNNGTVTNCTCSACH